MDEELSPTSAYNPYNTPESHTYLSSNFVLYAPNFRCPVQCHNNPEEYPSSDYPIYPISTPYQHIHFDNFTPMHAALFHMHDHVLIANLAYRIQTFPRPLVLRIPIIGTPPPDHPCYIDMLPNEILCTILRQCRELMMGRYFQIRAMRSIGLHEGILPPHFLFRAVCGRWKDVVDGDRVMWKDISWLMVSKSTTSGGLARYGQMALRRACGLDDVQTIPSVLYPCVPIRVSMLAWRRIPTEDVNYRSSSMSLGDVYNIGHAAIEPTVEYLLPFLSALTTLRLHLHLTTILPLLEAPSILLPHLETLDLIIRADRIHTFLPRYIRVFNQSPRLRTVKVDLTNVEAAGSIYPWPTIAVFHLPWHQLTELSYIDTMNSPYDSDNLICIVLKCTELRRLCLYWYAWELPGRCKLSEEVHSFPHLEYMRLYTQGCDGSTIKPFMDRIHLPALKHLDLDMNDGHFDDDNGVLELQKRSQAPLEYLKLYGSGGPRHVVGSAGLLEFLKHTPTLKTLWMHNLEHMREPELIAGLIPEPGQPILLPNLEHLWIHDKYIFHERDTPQERDALILQLHNQITAAVHLRGWADFFPVGLGPVTKLKSFVYANVFYTFPWDMEALLDRYKSEGLILGINRKQGSFFSFDREELEDLQMALQREEAAAALMEEDDDDDDDDDDEDEVGEEDGEDEEVEDDTD